jgi:hypothetical protein
MRTGEKVSGVGFGIEPKTKIELEITLPFDSRVYTAIDKTNTPIFHYSNTPSVLDHHE